MVAANRTVVDNNVPSPQSHSVPLERYLCYFRCADRRTASSGYTFLTSNFFLPSLEASVTLDISFALEAPEVVASFISTSAIFTCVGVVPYMFSERGVVGEGQMMPSLVAEARKRGAQLGGLRRFRLIEQAVPRLVRLGPVSLTDNLLRCTYGTV